MTLSLSLEAQELLKKFRHLIEYVEKADLSDEKNIGIRHRVTSELYQNASDQIILLLTKKAELEDEHIIAQLQNAAALLQCHLALQACEGSALLYLKTRDGTWQRLNESIHPEIVLTLIGNHQTLLMQLSEIADRAFAISPSEAGFARTQLWQRLLTTCDNLREDIDELQLLLEEPLLESFMAHLNDPNELFYKISHTYLDFVTELAQSTDLSQVPDWIEQLTLAKQTLRDALERFQEDIAHNNPYGPTPRAKRFIRFCKKQIKAYQKEAAFLGKIGVDGKIE